MNEDTKQAAEAHQQELESERWWTEYERRMKKIDDQLQELKRVDIDFERLFRRM